MQTDVVRLAKIDRFPSYAFSIDGRVVSYTRRKPFFMSPIKMGAYVGLQLLRNDGVSEKQYLHRLIAEAWHGPCPNGMVCRHLDGDKANNTASNLAWGTQSENNLDKLLHGTAPIGSNNPMAKLSYADVQKMRSIRQKNAYSYSKIAQQFSVTAMTAYRAINNQTWKNQ